MCLIFFCVTFSERELDDKPLFFGKPAVYLVTPEDEAKQACVKSRTVDRCLGVDGTQLVYYDAATFHQVCKIRVSYDRFLNEPFSAVEFSNLTANLWLNETGLANGELSRIAYERITCRRTLDVPIFACVGVDGNFIVLGFESGMPCVAERRSCAPFFHRAPA